MSSNCSFSHIVLKSCIKKRCKHLSLCGNELTLCGGRCFEKSMNSHKSISVTEKYDALAFITKSQLLTTWINKASENFV